MRLKMAAQTFSTPVNTITRDSLSVLIANNCHVLNNSLEFMSDSDTMESDSPIRKPNLQPISKKLFHSPMSGQSHDNTQPNHQPQKTRRAKKRKQMLVPNSSEKIKKVYVTECKRDSGEVDSGGMRRKVLISLFHNKEYSMDCDTSM